REKAKGSIKEQLADIAPALEQLCKQKEERIKKVTYVLPHKQTICGDTLVRRVKTANDPVASSDGNLTAMEDLILVSNRQLWLSSLKDTTYVAVAAAVNSIVSDSVVEPKCPEKSYSHLTVLMELLPNFGIPKGSPVVVVLVRPRKLIISKPRLCVKALVPDG
nr:hypothetical protein CTI12_AA072020 [Tanacetum cinerariifolium]